MQLHQQEWDESYSRNENFIFYPKEEVVKFLNRFVRKKVGVNEYLDILDFTNIVKGLDFGCGIGRITLLLKEFGIDAYGIDISSKAINLAKELANSLDYHDMDNKFLSVSDDKIPFPNDYFDIVISEAVLDSMSFQQAKVAIKEIDRVTKRLAFISLISGNDDKHCPEYAGEETVQTQHEHGTIQTYFNWERINELIRGSHFHLEWCHLIEEKSLLDDDKNGRYYIVLKK